MLFLLLLQLHSKHGFQWLFNIPSCGIFFINSLYELFIFSLSISPKSRIRGSEVGNCVVGVPVNHGFLVVFNFVRQNCFSFSGRILLKYVEEHAILVLMGES